VSEWYANVIVDECLRTWLASHLASFQGLPIFRSLVCIDNNTRKWNCCRNKPKKGKRDI